MRPVAPVSPGAAEQLPIGEDDALRSWRRDAADIVILAAVLLHLPGVLLLFAGDQGRTFMVVVLATYAGSVAVALLRRIDHVVRVWILLGLLYAMSALGAIVHPEGPYLRALPLVAPLVAVALIGVRSARVAAVVSALVIVVAPFLHWAPGVVHWLGAEPGSPPVPTGTLLLQGAALTGEMLILLFLLERYLSFLQGALEAERQAREEWAAVTRRLEGEIGQRRHLEHELARVADDERRHLGSEIHDGVCQQLTGALLRCQAIERCLERGAPPDVHEVGALSALLAETIQEARGVAQGLCPLDPTPEAIERAVRELARQAEHTSGVPCEVRITGDVEVPNPGTAQHLYRIAQEALSNAVRHAHARRIQVELEGTHDGLRLQVEDDGRGMPVGGGAGGLGLRTMAYRAQLLDGDLSIDATPAGGTRVSCRVPLSACASPLAVATGIGGGRGS
jgi:signal transduction histidine kinase